MTHNQQVLGSSPSWATNPVSYTHLDVYKRQLLLITAIEEFEENVKEILVHSGVSAFSYSPVKGYKSDEKQISLENWFASQISETDSLLFTAFVPEENVDKVYHLSLIHI